MDETDFRLSDGRVLHAYDSAPGEDDRLAVVWHHGTPGLGTPPAPLDVAAAELGIRWISFDRPGYGGSTPAPGRTVGSVAADLVTVLDTLGIQRCAQLGYSGGGTYALGAAALLGERVSAVATLAAIAPYDAKGLDWYDGMIASGLAALHAAADGREARLANEAVEYDPEFTEADFAMFDGPWGWLGSVAGGPHGPDGPVDDDCSYVLPWEWATITAPTLLVHGTADRIIPYAHGRWLADNLPTATLELHDGRSHITILDHAEQALRWLGSRSV